MMAFFLKNTQLVASEDMNWWTRVLWIIVMLLSAVWILILMQMLHFSKSFKMKNQSHCIFWIAWGWVHFCACLFTFTFSHLSDAFIQSDLQMRTMEATKINKRPMICKCIFKYNWAAAPCPLFQNRSVPLQVVLQIIYTKICLVLINMSMLISSF